MLYDNNDLNALRERSTAAISDALDTITRRQQTISPSISLLYGQRIFGPAITIMVAATAEKAFHKVCMQTLDECEEGSVIVLAGDPDPITAAFTTTEIAIASKRRLGGLLTDCAVRTPAVSAPDAVGVAGAGRSPASGFGRIKTMALCPSSTCGGVTINQGDIIVGDHLGVVVIPTKLVHEIAVIAHRYEQRIADMERDIDVSGSLRGATDRHWKIVEAEAEGDGQ